MITTDPFGLFQITFDNGYTVSIGNGHTHYRTGRNLDIAVDELLKPGRLDTTDVEVALIDSTAKERDKHFVICPGFESDFEDDDVTGWKDPEWIGRFITAVQALKYGDAKPREDT